MSGQSSSRAPLGAEDFGYPTCRECGYSWLISHEDALSLISSVAPRYARLLEGRADSRRKPDERTWSPSGYVWHLSDWLRIQGQRIYSRTHEPDYTHVSLEPDELDAMFHYDELSPARGGWALDRSAADFLAAARDADRELTFTAPNGASWTVGELIVYVGHEVVHHDLDIRRGLKIDE